MQLDKYDIALSRIAAQEDTRPILQNVHYIEGRLEAVDGCMMVRRQANVKTEEQVPEFLASAELLRKVTVDKNRVPNLTSDGQAIALSYADAKGKPIPHNPTLRFEAASGTFPATDQLLPTTPHKGRIAVGVGILKKALACLPDNGILQIGFGDETKPIEAVCGNMTRPIHLVFMPMYVDWKGFEWPRPASKPAEQVQP